MHIQNPEGYDVVDWLSLDCKDEKQECAFMHSMKCLNHPCLPSRREDKRRVIFVKKEKHAV